MWRRPEPASRHVRPVRRVRPRASACMPCTELLHARLRRLHLLTRVLEDLHILVAISFAHGKKKTLMKPVGELLQPLEDMKSTTRIRPAWRTRA